MAKSKEHQFDISAKLDMQEMKNAVIQSQKEVDNRYDFKGIEKDIDLNHSGDCRNLICRTHTHIVQIRITSFLYHGFMWRDFVYLLGCLCTTNQGDLHK